jgi:actin-related protein
LPTFFQKYDAASKKLTVGFSETTFALGEGDYDVDAGSKFVKSMKVFKDAYKGVPFLKIEMDVGTAITSDKNEIALDKSNFLIKLKSKGGKSWTLSKLFAERKKAAEKQAALDKKAAEKAAAEEKKAAQKAALEEKKRLADEKKAAEKRAAEEKKAAEKAALEEKKRLAEEKKAAEKRAAEEKKAAAKAAAEEKKRLAEEKKAAEKAALEEKKRLAEEKKAAEKAAREAERLFAEQQKQIDKAVLEGGAISALLPGLKEMTVLIGSGLEQFRIVADEAIAIQNVSSIDKNNTITIGLAGPQKSPVFRIGAGSLVKSVTWGANGLKVQLKGSAQPAVLVQDGVFVLQIAEKGINKDGFMFWSAQPKGIYVRDWLKPADDRPNFDVFVKNLDKGSKKIISGSQTFHLRPVVRELIVVADETEFYAAPNENSQVMQRLVFGDRLVSLDMKGQYRKVQSGNRVGYVDRRAVGFFDELSSVQEERLKQIDKERGTNLTGGAVPVGSQLDGLYEDRVTYSSFGRRDPFVEVDGLVEEGINIDQVELVGIIWESDVPVAILVESKNPSISYTVKEGDKILNGKVLKITQTDVLFLIQEFGVSRRYSMGLPDKLGGQK